MTSRRAVWDRVDPGLSVVLVMAFLGAVVALEVQAAGQEGGPPLRVFGSTELTRPVDWESEIATCSHCGYEVVEAQRHCTHCGRCFEWTTAACDRCGGEGEVSCPCPCGCGGPSVSGCSFCGESGQVSCVTCRGDGVLGN
jgi:hypothetical protein